MAQTIKTPLSSRSTRLKYPVRDGKLRGKPYDFTWVAPGISVGYRRVETGNGSWVVRGADGEGGSWQKVIGLADDYDEANGDTVLSYDQASDRAKLLARGGATVASVNRDTPTTNLAALLIYKAEVRNPKDATRVIGYLPPWLADRPVAECRQKDYRDFRNLLLTTKSRLGKKLAPGSVMRVLKSFKAALNLAAKGDERILNSKAWENGFEGIENSRVADTENNASEKEIVALVAACYEFQERLGLLVDVAAQTGARPIQIASLLVAHLRLDAPGPRLMMPSSKKGKKGSTPRPPVALPIKGKLVERLREAAAGRKPSEPLLLWNLATSWLTTNEHGVITVRQYSKDLRKIVTRLGMSPTFSLYGLRHASIIRQLMTPGMPIRVVAENHDNSVEIIEAHYGSYITRFADDLVRAAVLNTDGGSNVIKLRA